MSKCGKCGEEGHNARSCKQGVTERPSKVAKKTAGAPAKRVAPPSNSTVSEALLARQKELQGELAVIDRVLADLSAIGIT